MCGCILGWQSVTYHNLVTVTLNLTFDLVSKNWMPECHKPFLGHCDLDLWPSFKNYCVQSIFPILFDVGIPNLGWWFLFGWRSGANHFESLWPWHWLLALFLGFSCYITANFPQMCLMLEQFLWGHSSRVCDISCSEAVWSGLYSLSNSVYLSPMLCLLI